MEQAYIKIDFELNKLKLTLKLNQNFWDCGLSTLLYIQFPAVIDKHIHCFVSISNVILMEQTFTVFTTDVS